MRKRLLSLVLTLGMVVLMFSGCGKKAEVTTNSDTSTTSETSVTTDTTDTSAAPAEKSGEIVKLKMVMIAPGDNPDAALIQDEINKITREKIGAEIELTFINFGSWVQQTNLMLSSGEQIDVMPTMMMPLSTYVASGQYLALDDLLDKYGDGIKANIAQKYIDCGRVNGKLYGITTNRDLAASTGFTMRKDLADKYGIDYTNIKSLADVEAALRVIKEKEPDLYPCVPQGGPQLLSTGWTYDALNDSTNALGVLLDGGAELKVVNYYDTQEYKDFTTTTRRWYKDGLIMADILNNTETGTSIVKAGKAFGYLSNTKPGFAAQETRATGYEMVTADFIPAFATTGNVSGIVWSIPVNSANPDMAMQFMNLMYSDKGISDLLIYGIEGKHYKVTDAATGMIDYADGVNAANSGYPGGSGWAFPNQFIGYVWAGNDPDYWKQMDEFNNSAKPSKALGFTYDAANVSTEMAACSNVVSQYKNALMGGVIDPVEAIPQFNKELKDAGIDKIIADKQSQLDAWAAAQK